MVFCILLLIGLILYLSRSLAENVTQAEQNHNITLEWTFTTKPDMSITSVYIYCDLLTDDRALVLFHLHEGVEVSESQDKQFSGRVQFGRDELRKGRFILHLCRLRTDDSGLYVCKIQTSNGLNVDRYRLNVTAAVSPEPKNRGGTGLYPALALTAAALLFCLFIGVHLNIAQDKTVNLRQDEREKSPTSEPAGLDVKDPPSVPEIHG